MGNIPTLIVTSGAIVSAVATVCIAWYAVANHRLANAIKSSNEQHQQEMNEILKSLPKAIYHHSNSESRKEVHEVLKERELKQRKKFVSQGK